MVQILIMGAVIGYLSDQYYVSKYGAGSPEAKEGRLKTSMFIVFLAILMSL